MGKILKDIGKVLGTIAGGAVGFLVGGPVGAVAGAMMIGGAVTSKKPLVKLEKEVIGGAEGFVLSGFNPLGAAAGGAFSSFIGGKPAGKTNLLAGAAGGILGGAVGAFGTTTTTITASGASQV